MFGNYAELRLFDSNQQEETSTTTSPPKWTITI